MRRHLWKVLGVGLAGGVVALCILGQGNVVAGDPVQPASDITQPSPAAVEHEPGQPYGLGPNPILYETQSKEEQDNLDRVFETLEANQPASSHEAWGRAADQAVVRAQAEIAARAVGLEGVDEQGVVP